MKTDKTFKLRCQASHDENDSCRTTFFRGWKPLPREVSVFWYSFIRDVMNENAIADLTPDT